MLGEEAPSPCSAAIALLGIAISAAIALVPLVSNNGMVHR